MPLNPAQLSKVIEDLLSVYRDEKPRLDEIAAYKANKVNDIYVPKKATAEYRMLVDQARFNILPLIVTSVAQNLFVDGYRPTGPNGRAPSTENSPIWDMVWQPNRMDARQGAIHRPAITYGYSYATVLPGEPAPVITPWSPRKLTALYDDPLHDEWPRYAMVVRRSESKEKLDQGSKLTVYDDEFRYEVVHGVTGWELLEQVDEHGLGVPPVVRYLEEWDGDELPKGKIEPLLPVQRQLNQTTFGLLMAQQFSAFRQRTATGMAIEIDENGSPINPFVAGADEVWVNTSPDGRFGEFGQTDLGGYLNSRDKGLLFVSAVAQVPPHNMLVGSGISNISAEALVALESAHRHDIDEHQTSLGESHEQTLRLSGKALGGAEGRAAWEDMSAQVVWRDTTPRSLAQVADALGKLAQQLGIPPRALWERIPGVTDQDIERWERMADEQDALDEMERIVAEANRQQEAPDAVDAGEPANRAAPAGAASANGAGRPPGQPTRPPR